MEKRIRGRRGKRIIQFDKNGEKLTVFESVKEASEKTGIDYQMISLVARGRAKSAGGFIWRYGDEEGEVSLSGTFYCQSCGKETPTRDGVMVCLDCVKKQKNIVGIGGRKRIVYVPVEITEEDFARLRK